MVEITLKSIAKSYGAFHVFRDLSLTIPSNSYVCLLGPSGCGKSTLMRIIAGLEDENAGEIGFDGERVNERTSVERDVGLAFQNYALYPHLNVQENLKFPLRAPVRKRQYTDAIIDARVKEIAELLRIDHLLDRSINQLSGGQQQRVALGRALVRKPRVLLLDEPVTHLDAKLRHEMRVELKRLHHVMGTTTIHVTHDQEEAMAMADQIILMRNGGVEQYGPPMELYDRPRTAFTAGFLGDPPRSIVKVDLAPGGDGPRVMLAGAMLGADVPTDQAGLLGRHARAIMALPTAAVTCLDGPADADLSGEVIAHEMVDRQQRIVFDAGGQRLYYQTMTPRRVKIGDRVPLALSLDRARFFDAETGGALGSDRSLTHANSGELS